MVQFSNHFRLQTPIPKGLLPILTKDENRQRALLRRAYENARIGPEKEDAFVQLLRIEEALEAKQLKRAVADTIATRNAAETPAADFAESGLKLKAVEDPMAGTQNHAHEVKASVQRRKQPDSSIGTAANTYGSLSSAIPKSTIPSSISKAKSSIPVTYKNVATQDQIIDQMRYVSAVHESSSIVETHTNIEVQSVYSIDSVEALTLSQKELLISRFTEALLSKLPNRLLLSHHSSNLRVPFQERFLVLLSTYSEEVKKDASERSHRQAAKHVRLLRRQISHRCEEALGGIESNAKGQREHPNIVKEVEKLNLPEKMWEEKVSDWSQSDFVGETQLPAMYSYASLPVHTPEYQLGSEDGLESLSVVHTSLMSDVGEGVACDISKDGEALGNNTAENARIHEFMTTHNAFQQLVFDVQKLVERHYSNRMDLVRHCIFLSIRRPSYFNPYSRGRFQARFRVGWDIPKFLCHYTCGNDQDLGSILAITGEAGNAYLSTIRSYLERTWPTNPVVLLDAVQRAITNTICGRTSYCK